MAKILHCNRCRERTNHRRVGNSDSLVDGVPLGRIIMAIGTLGLAETMRDVHYQCSICKKIKTVKN